MFGMASLVFGMVQSAGTETSDFLAAIDLIKPQSKICAPLFSTCLSFSAWISGSQWEVEVAEYVKRLI